MQNLMLHHQPWIIKKATVISCFVCKALSDRYILKGKVFYFTPRLPLHIDSTAGGAVWPKPLILTQYRINSDSFGDTANSFLLILPF